MEVAIQLLWNYNDPNLAGNRPFPTLRIATFG